MRQFFASRIEAGGAGQLFGPFPRHQAAPWIARLGQRLPRRAAEQLCPEVVEGPVDFSGGDARRVAVEIGGEHRLPTRMEVPGDIGMASCGGRGCQSGSLSLDDGKYKKKTKSN